MKIGRRLLLYLKSPASHKRLFAEAYISLGRAWIIKSLPFTKMSPLLGEYMKETGYEQTADQAVLKSISSAVHIMSKYTLWNSQCLVRALAVSRMLETRKISSTLYLGTGRDEEGQLAAHAWIRSGSLLLSGAEEQERFTAVAKFAKFPKKGAVNEKYISDHSAPFK